MRKMLLKRIISLGLVVCMAFCCGITSFAEGTNNIPSFISPLGLWGGDRTANSWSSGTFNVYVPNYIFRAGMTLKTECSDPNSGGGVFFYVYDPNGRLVTNDEILGPNDEDNTLKIWNAPSGTYKVEYSIHGTTAPVHMYCWIYG